MWSLILLACTGGDGPKGGGCLGCDGSDDPGAEHPGDGGDTGGAGDTGYEDAFLYGDETLAFSLELSEAAIAALATDPDEDVEDVPATFSWDGETWDVGVQLKGGNGSFRRFDEKPSFRLDFTRYGGPRFYGNRYVVLNNLVQDASMLGEHAAYEVYGTLGVEAPRHGYARVTVNGEWFGLYGVLEDVHLDFLRRRWPGDADGPLLKGGADLVPGDEEDFKTVEGEGQGPLATTIAELAAAEGDAWLDTLGGWFDRDELLDTWAIEIATGNPDAYVTRHNNYFLYWRPDAATWATIPWGTDTAFVDPLPRWREDYEGQLYLQCLAVPACVDALEERLDRIVTWWASGELEATMRDVADRTAEDCLTDPRSEVGPEGCAMARERFFAFVAGRPAELREPTR